MLTLHAEPRHPGAGTALLEAFEAVAREAGCTRIWLITTNDNVDALRFYQRRGFRLSARPPGRNPRYHERQLKPRIPELGAYDIPLRDELELNAALAARRRQATLRPFSPRS